MKNKSRNIMKKIKKEKSWDERMREITYELYEEAVKHGRIIHDLEKLDEVLIKLNEKERELIVEYEVYELMNLEINGIILELMNLSSKARDMEGENSYSELSQHIQARLRELKPQVERIENYDGVIAGRGNRRTVEQIIAELDELHQQANQAHEDMMNTISRNIGDNDER
jgi:DNA gyrase/topoisomerase IV subunit A